MLRIFLVSTRGSYRCKKIRNCLPDGWDVGCLLSLGALCHFKADLMSFFERLESAHVDCGKVRNQVCAAIIGDDKTKTFRIVKPFNCTGCDDSSCFENRKRTPASLVAPKIVCLCYCIVVSPQTGTQGYTLPFYVTVTLIALAFCWAFADLASVTLSMPSLNSAFTLFSSASSGTWKLRMKLP